MYESDSRIGVMHMLYQFETLEAPCSGGIRVTLAQNFSRNR